MRRQLAASLGALPAGPRETAARDAARRATATIRSRSMPRSAALRGSEATVLDALLQAGGAQTPQREAAITMLAATIVRSGEDAAIQKLSRDGGRRRDGRHGSDRRCCAAPRSRCSARRCRARARAPTGRRRLRPPALPDLSGRPRGPGRRLCVSQAGRSARSSSTRHARDRAPS